MNKKQAESLLRLVGSKEWSEFIEYQEYKLNKLHLDLEYQKGDSAIETQGRIKEIRECLNLQKKVNDIFLQNN